MTQASISPVTTPIGLADLEPLLYDLVLAVNLSGIGSGPVAYPMQPLPTSWLGSLNSFAAAVNAVTAFNTVTEATTSDPASLTGIVNTMIEEINAFVSGGGGGLPLDVVPGAVVAYGQRALSTVMLGSPLYTIREDAGDTTQSFDSDAVTGEAPVAAITAFLAGADGFVATWNDQSGAAIDGVQATGANQPQWLSSVANARPGFLAASGRGLSTASFSFTGGELYFVAAVKIDDISAAPVFLNMPSGVNLGSFYNTEGDLSFINAAGGEWATASLVGNGVHLVELIVAADGTPTILVDGVDMLATLQFGSLTPVASGTRSLEYPDNANGGLTVLEGLLYGAVSISGRSDIEQDVASYYGISL